MTIIEYRDPPVQGAIISLYIAHAYISLRYLTRREIMCAVAH